MQLSNSLIPRSVASSNYLLRQYGGAAAAYSLQRLDTSVENVVRARRSTDDAEADFTAQEVSGGSLREFALNNDADLIRFADQAVAADERMYFDGSNDYVSLPFDTSSCTNATITLYDVTIQDDTGILLVNGGSGSPFVMCYQSGSTSSSSSTSGSPTTYVDDVAIGSTRDNLYAALSDGLPHKVEVRGADLTGWGNIPRLGWYFLSPFQVTGIIGRVSVDYTGDGTLDADYLGQGNTDADWEDQVGSNDGTVNGTPALFSGQGFDAYVTTLYDQSGNGRDATQATAASQPQIVADGVVVTDSNGNASMDFDGVDDAFESTSFVSAQPNHYFAVFSSSPTPNEGSIFDGNGNRNLFDSTGTSWRIFAGTSVTGGTRDVDQHLASALYSGASSGLWIDGASTISADAGTQGITIGLVIGSNNALADPLSGQISELVMYGSDQSANRAAIEANIASRYGITI
jgi:hypothetical protein